MYRYLATLLFPLILLSACDEAGNVSFLEDLLPKSSFTGPIDKRATDISRILPDSFLVRKDGDSVIYRASFDRASGRSFLTFGKNDTAFAGFVSRQKNLYFLSQPISDTTWWISALQVNGETVRGLGTSWLQMLVVDSVIVSENFKGIVLHQDSAGYRLKPDRKLLPDIYEHILSKVPADTIIRFRTTGKITKQDTPDPADESFLSAEGKADDFYVYPNPASMFCSVKAEQYPFTFSILDLQSNVKTKGTLRGSDEKIDLTSLYNGIYLIRGTDGTGKTSACRFEVRH